MENPFVKLFAVNLKDHLEVKKSGSTELKYVSWPYAWAEVKKLYPSASYEVKKFNGLPYVYDPITGFMVYTSVTIEGVTLSDTDSEVTLVCNDEGKLLGLPLNRPLWDGADVLAGPGFLAGCDNEGNMTSLPQSAMDFYKEKFRAFIIEI